MKKKKDIIKSMIFGFIIGILLGLVGLVSYAMFTYNSSSTNGKLLVGDIYLKYKENNTFTLENAMPSVTYDSTKYFEFEIDGKNTSSKDIWYEVEVKHGDVPTEKTEQNRLIDRFLKFTLTEQIDNGTEEIVVDGESWEGLSNGKTIWVDKILNNTTNDTTHLYKLYMWIDNKVGIGTDTTYTIFEWNNIFASININVNADFTEKEIDEEYNTVNVMNTFPEAITNQKTNIKEVYFNKMKESDMTTRYNAATIKADLTYNNEGKVLAWLEPDTIDNTKYIMYVASDGETYLTTGDGLFNNWSSMQKIEFNNINTI